MPEAQRLVYVLKSANPKARYYVGLTSNVSARLADHNAGHCPHTMRYRPWQLHVTIQLPDEQHAVDFERYLKSGSGCAFARRHSMNTFVQQWSALGRTDVVLVRR